MSCSVILQNDWLEYENGLSVWSKIASVMIILIGSTLLYYQIKIEKSTSSASLKPSVALTRMLKILQSLCAVIIVLPIFFLFLSFVPTTNTAPFPIIFSGSIVMCAIALTIVALIAGIQIEIGKMNISFPTFVWLPASLLAAASTLFLIYRYRSRENINIPKQRVSWTNIRQNGELIEAIGRKQSMSCGITIPEGQSVDALVYHIQQKNEEHGKKSFFSRIFKSKSDDEIVHPDKLPNIMKMYANMMQDAEEEEERKVYVSKKSKSSSASRPNAVNAVEQNEGLETPDNDGQNGVLASLGNAYNYYFK